MEEENFVFFMSLFDTLGGVSARSDGTLVSISIGFSFDLETDGATGNSETLILALVGSKPFNPTEVGSRP